jgi:hypothetical protein
MNTLSWLADKAGISLPSLPDLPDLENFPMDYLMGAGGGYVVGKMLFDNGVIGALIGLYAGYIISRMKAGADFTQAANPFSGWVAPAATAAATVGAAGATAGAVAGADTAYSLASRAQDGTLARAPASVPAAGGDTGTQQPATNEEAAYHAEFTGAAEVPAANEDTLERTAPSVPRVPAETPAAAAPAAPKEELGWWGKRWEAISRHTVNAAKAVTVDLPGNIADAGRGIASGAASAWDKVSGAYGTTVDWTSRKIIEPTATFLEHPIDNTWHGIKVAGTGIKDLSVYVWNNPGEAAKRTGQGVLLAGQGVLNAGASIGGMVGDLAVFGVNTVTLVPRKVLEGTTAFFGFDEGVTTFPKIEHNYMTAWPKWMNNTTGVVAYIEKDQGRPLGGFQKTILYGTQGVAETAAFIVAGMATAGTATAALATIRGGSLVAKGATTVNTAKTAVTATETVATVAETAATTATTATTVTAETASAAARRGANSAFRMLRPWTDDATLAARFQQRAVEAAAKADELKAAGDVTRAAEYATRAEQASARAKELSESIATRGNRVRVDGFNSGAEAAGALLSVYMGTRAYDQTTKEGDQRIADMLLGGEDPNSIPSLEELNRQLTAIRTADSEISSTFGDSVNKTSTPAGPARRQSTEPGQNPVEEFNHDNI